MAPHEALAFDLEIDTSDIEAGLRVADRLMKPNLIGALEVAASAVARRARQEHGYTDRTGALTKSIHYEPAYSMSNGRMAVEVVADAPHAAAQEYGAKPHVIRAKPGKTLRFYASGGGGLFGDPIFAQSVNHPGNKAQNFLKNAMDAEVFDAAGSVAQYALESLYDAGFQ